MQRHAVRSVLIMFLISVAAAPGGHAAPAVDALPARTDLLGDPLPKGAIARLGTLRFRHGDMVRNLGFFPDGKTLLSADWHAVHVWDAATGRLIRCFGDPHGRQFQDIAFSADGSTAALTMSDGEISIWDAAHGQELAPV